MTNGLTDHMVKSSARCVGIIEAKLMTRAYRCAVRDENHTRRPRRRKVISGLTAARRDYRACLADWR
jgi:hypothetical protein